jgi:hypothetical protein
VRLAQAAARQALLSAQGPLPPRASSSRRRSRRRDGVGSGARRSAASRGRSRATLRRKDADRVAVVGRPGVMPSAMLSIGNGMMR